MLTTVGENHSEMLHHDYVVRQWLGEFKVGADGKINQSREIQLQSGWSQRDLNVVAFVQNSATGKILQALALGFCED
ncbi:hypothetical protein [Methylophilus sp. 14]|uniref:hypothetical protein n=1 Tax=Methylophilus sp. 14 TaxID=2781019 RepID=UPI00188F6469|nr:hypothetical protein [Methylophilus sp. 14]MBF4986652.1 hypothetical protein [Methylophilus sp. 14]